MLRDHWLSCAVVAACVSVAGPAVAAEADVASELAVHLQRGHIAEAEAELRERLTADPKHNEARFAYGVVKVLSAIEELGQHQYRYGAMAGMLRNLPVMRLPIPVNPTPEEVTYQQVRDLFQQFQSRLLEAEAELAKVDVGGDVKLPLDLATVGLDLTGDGVIGAGENFLAIFGVANRPRPGVQPEWRIAFDAGDVPWLRGYCHFLAGFCDLVLAYDHQRLFDHCGQLAYPRHVSSMPLPQPLDVDARPAGFERQIMDAIAGLHLVNLPLKEPDRMRSARQHLLAMIRTSRESWELILAETDNDREWLPNPKQTGVLRIPVTQDVIDGWHGVLAEMEDLLEGRKLVPFWRDHSGALFLGSFRDIPAEGRGVNLKRFFDEPRDFDLILLLQGTGALPYVEQGQLTQPETWRNLTRVFQGQFFGFAVWFN